MSDITACLNDLSYIPLNNEQNEPTQGDIGETSNDPTQAKRNEFEELYASANEELYHGCDYVTRLDFMAKFTYFKVKAKKDVHFCPVCNTSRWKDSNTPGKKVPKKVFHYFLIIPRLQCLYKSSHTANEMTWHATGKCTVPGKMRHPVDGRAWKDFDTLCRKVRSAEGYVAEEKAVTFSFLVSGCTTEFNRPDRNVDCPPQRGQFKVFKITMLNRWVFTVGCIVLITQELKKVICVIPNKALKEDIPGCVLGSSSELFAMACRDITVSIQSLLVVNGVRFVVHSRDERRTTQKAAFVRGPDGEMYYGQLESILLMSHGVTAGARLEVMIVPLPISSYHWLWGLLRLRDPLTCVPYGIARGHKSHAGIQQHCKRSQWQEGSCSQRKILDSEEGRDLCPVSAQDGDVPHIEVNWAMRSLHFE
ncbi:hypothetical protein Tco_0968373 [Tanacetum coccineum]